MAPMGLTLCSIIFVSPVSHCGALAHLINAEYYSYNVGSMLVMFWAFELAQSVYGLSAKPHLRQALRRINAAGKLVAVLFPTVTILLLRAPAVQKVFIVFILLADLPCKYSLEGFAYGVLTYLQ